MNKRIVDETNVDEFVRRDDNEDGEKHTLTCELTPLDGSMLQLLKEAVASTTSVVARVCERTKSLLIFNKMAGQSVTLRGLHGNGARELLLFSAFERHDTMTAYSPTNFVLAEAYGGTVRRCDQNEEERSVYEIRPAVMDCASNNLLSVASDIGWRMIMHTSTGDDDPAPTCLVALQGFVATAERDTTTTTNRLMMVDEKNDAAIAARFSKVLAACKATSDSREEATTTAMEVVSL